MSVFKKTVLWLTVWLPVGIAGGQYTIGAQESTPSPTFFSSDHPLSLEEVVRYAHEHNPTIQAARARMLAAQQRPTQVSALDDPMFTYEGFNIPENFDLAHADNNILKL